MLGSDHTLASCTLADLGSSSGYAGESLLLFALSFYDMSCSSEVERKEKTRQEK